MAEIQHKYVSLEKTTQISRRHKRDIELPGLVSLKNMFVSRSDNVPSLRPGFRYTNEIINSYADQVVSGNNIPEYVNSIAGVYGTNDLIYFTSFWPQAATTGAANPSSGPPLGTQISEILALPLSSIPYTATVTNGSPTVVVSSADFGALTKVYQGCFVQFEEDSDQYYYVVNSVLDSTTFVLDSDIDTSNFSSTTTSFTVYHAANPANLGGYKYHIDQYGSETLYGAGGLGGITNDENSIVGPWSSETSFYTPKYEFDVSLGDSIATVDYVGNEWINHSYGGDGFAVGENIAVYGIPRSDDFWYCDDITADGFQDVTNNWFDDAALSDCDFMSVVYNTTDNKFYSVYIDDASPNYWWEICTWTDNTSPTAHQYSTGTDAASAALHSSGSVVSILYVPDVDEVWFSYEEQLFAYGSSATVKRWDCAGEEWLADLIISAGGAYRIYDMIYDAEGNRVIMMLGGSYSLGPPKRKVGFHVVNSDGSSGFGVFANDGDEHRHGGTSIYDGTNSFNVSFGYNQVMSGTTSQHYPTTEQTDFDTFYTLRPSRPILYDGDQHDETLVSATGMIGGYGARVLACDVDLGSSDTSQILTNNKVIANLADDVYFGVGGSGSKYSTSRPAPTLATDDYGNRYYLAVACFYDGDGSTWTLSPLTIQASLTGGGTSTVSQRFTLLSDLYRSRAFAVMDGYTILFGTREYDETSTKWTYNPRRVRWTSPGTVANFTDPGAGFGDVRGNGQFVDARAVNGRVVTFETTSISALVPRGIVLDPWDYETIHADIRILSNPVAVKDQCYFIASDGLLYSTDGINVQEVGSSLDITEFDDYTEDKPIWLIFVPRMNSLAAFYPPSGTGEGPHSIFFISLANGSVSHAEFNDVKNGGADPEDVDVSPRSILNVEYSEDQRFIVSFDPHSETDPIRITAASMRFGDPIDGKDKFTATSTYDQYYHGELETGEIYLVPEGYKSALKHIILRTYADDQNEMPSIFVKFKSLQDEDWTNVGDKFLQAAITIDGISCVLPDTTPIIGACSSRLGLPGGNVTYNLPWPTDNCRFFHETGGTYTQMTETTNNPPVLNSRTYLKAGMYQVEVNENDGYVYAFCENEPAVTASVGDLIYHDTSDEASKVNSIDNLRTLILSSFLNPDYGSTANNASHMYGHEVPAEDGEVKVGMSHLGEGFKLLIGLVPVTDSDSDDEATVAKITGITFGYVPLGRKTLEASGS